MSEIKEIHNLIESMEIDEESEKYFLLDSIHTLDKKYKEFLDTISSLESKNQKLNNDNLNLKNYLKESDDTISTLKETLKQISLKLEELTSQNLHYEKNIGLLNAHIESLEIEYNLKLASCNKIINTKHEFFEQELNKEKERSKLNKEKNIAELQSIITTLENTIHDYSIKLIEKDNKIHNLENDIASIINVQNENFKSDESTDNSNYLSLSDEISLINQKEDLMLLQRDYKHLSFVNRNLVLENNKLKDINESKLPMCKLCRII